MKFILTETYSEEGYYSDRKDIIEINSVQDILDIIEKECDEWGIIIFKNDPEKTKIKYTIEIYNGYRE